MCGIVGIWKNYSTKELDLISEGNAMTNAIKYRGPDNSGIWTEPSSSLLLGHQRLAILDLSEAGNQPMTSASGRYVITYNGEIYNHLNLRKDLEESDLIYRPWIGYSDTETLLAAIEAWGIEEALIRSTGMFSFGLWDRSERSLHLARDRFGEKPLYWGLKKISSSSQQSIVFGSELSAIYALPGVCTSINRVALENFLRKGCIEAPLCIEEGLRQLSPGHYVTISSNKEGYFSLQLPVEKSWWYSGLAAKSAQENQYSNETNALQDLENTLLNSIKQQTLSDVPLGVFLSGGVDSSLITALLQSQSETAINSFTISFPEGGFDEKSFDEGVHAKKVAEYLGTNHCEVPLTSSDALRLIPYLPRIYSEPFADSSQLPTHLICHEARKNGFKVALSGDGGDELFGGYNRHKFAYRLQRYSSFLPKSLRYLLVESLLNIPFQSKGLFRDKLQKLSLAINNSDSIEKVYESLTTIWPNSPEVLLDFSVKENSFIKNLPDSKTIPERLMLADLLGYLPSDLLVKIDRAAMASSLETRAPFLDHKVAEIAWRLPLSMKIRNNSGKWALKKILHKYIPSELVERPKTGFSIPLGSWLRGPLKDWANNFLASDLLNQQGFLNHKTIKSLWKDHLDQKADNSSKLWTILMWQAWLEEWT